MIQIAISTPSAAKGLPSISGTTGASIGTFSLALALRAGAGGDAPSEDAEAAPSAKQLPAIVVGRQDLAGDGIELPVDGEHPAKADGDGDEDQPADDGIDAIAFGWMAIAEPPPAPPTATGASGDKAGGVSAIASRDGTVRPVGDSAGPDVSEATAEVEADVLKRRAKVIDSHGERVSPASLAKVHSDRPSEKRLQSADAQHAIRFASALRMTETKVQAGAADSDPAAAAPNAAPIAVGQRTSETVAKLPVSADPVVAADAAKDTAKISDPAIVRPTTRHDTVAVGTARDQADIRQPQLASQPSVAARPTHGDHVATGQAQAPRPTDFRPAMQPLSVVPQAFAEALHASDGQQKMIRVAAADHGGDDARLGAVLAGHHTMATNPATAVTGAGASGQHQPLDLRQDQGLQQMIDRIEVLKTDNGGQDAKIRLAPDALGTVDIAVRRDGDKVHVHFTAQEAAARSVIADAAPRLAELADTRGVKLGQTTVDAGTSGNGQHSNHGAPQSGSQHNRLAPPEAAPSDTDDNRIA